MTASKPPTVRRALGGVVLDSGDFPRLQTALAVLLRKAVAESKDVQDCAQRCGVSVAELRRISCVTHVPLLFQVGGGS